MLRFNRHICTQSTNPYKHKSLDAHVKCSRLPHPPTKGNMKSNKLSFITLDCVRAKSCSKSTVVLEYPVTFVVNMEVPFTDSRYVLRLLRQSVKLQSNPDRGSRTRIGECLVDIGE